MRCLVSGSIPFHSLFVFPSFFLCCAVLCYKNINSATKKEAGKHPDDPGYPVNQVAGVSTNASALGWGGGFVRFWDGVVVVWEGRGYNFVGG